MSNFENLKYAVLCASESDSWFDAVYEWRIIGCEVDYTCASKCICGKEQIKYLFRILNIYNGNVMFPIGSKCIKRFEVDQLSEEVDYYEQLARLVSATKSNKFISLDSSLFSRKLLQFLYERGAFKPSVYNRGSAFNDYKFMLDMFNRRTPPTNKQDKKIKAIILNHIIPFARSCIVS